jgi:hypothetical protein
VCEWGVCVGGSICESVCEYVHSVTTSVSMCVQCIHVHAISQLVAEINY